MKVCHEGFSTKPDAAFKFTDAVGNDNEMGDENTGDKDRGRGKDPAREHKNVIFLPHVKAGSDPPQDPLPCITLRISRKKMKPAP